MNAIYYALIALILGGSTPTFTSNIGGADSSSSRIRGRNISKNTPQITVGEDETDPEDDNG